MHDPQSFCQSIQALIDSPPIVRVDRRIDLAGAERDDEVEDDQGEVGGGDRIKKVDRPRAGVESVSETYSNFLEFGARA